MRKELINTIQCPNCGNSKSFELTVTNENDKEIREGEIQCNSCQTKYSIHKGVVNLLVDSTGSNQAQGAWIDLDLQEEGLPFQVENAELYKNELFSLPDGNESEFFQKNTLLKSISYEKESFRKALDFLNLKGNEKILDLGADICWSTYRFAEKGSYCVALDINHHLPISDVYIYNKDIYFERVVGDMQDLPFSDNTFDLTITVASIHHIANIDPVFKEMARVLKPDGKGILISEPIRRLQDPKDYGTAQSIKYQCGDHWFTATEYAKSASKAGLKMKFSFDIDNVTVIYKEDAIWKKMAKYILRNLSFLKSLLPFFQLFFSFGNTIMIVHKKK